MAGNKDFFKAPQPAAVLKHGILSRYVTVFASKTGSMSSGGKVVFLDGYAGPGMYESGDPASPMLAIETARKISAFRSLRCVFVELDRGYHQQLEQMLAEHATDLDAESHQGPIEDHLQALVQRFGDVPLFAYLDPFGVGVPFDSLAGTLLGRGKGGYPKTEVLLNFSVQALDRIGGMINSQAKNRDATLARMDTTLGGNWWQQVYLANARVDRVGAIVRGYRERLSQATGGWGGWTVPVADKFGARPEYLLMHFTQHPDGHWEFHQALSQATREWRVAVQAANPTWRQQREAAGQFTFEGLEEPPPFEENEDAWLEEIAANVRSLVATEPPFHVQKRMTEVFGKAVGLARETHLRKALRQLWEQGILQDKPSGKLQEYVVALRQPTS